MLEGTWSFLDLQIALNQVAWIEWDRSQRGPKRIHTHESSIDREDATTRCSPTWENHLPVFSFVWNWDEANPIRRRSHRHDPVYHQIAFRFASTSSSELILSTSRTSSRFSDRAVQILMQAGKTLAPYAIAFQNREDALKQSKLIASLLEKRYGLRNTHHLSSGELQLLNDLTTGRKIRSIAQSKNVRRDTVSRQLSAAREKLGVGSNKELLSLLRPF